MVQYLEMADTMKENVCGRVIAMLSRKEDTSPEIIADLVRAVSVADEPPLVIQKPVMPLSACVAMLVSGVALALVIVHSTSPDEEEEEDINDPRG